MLGAWETKSMALRALMYAVIAAALTYYSGIGADLSAARPLANVVHCAVT
jgi:hypothetical protein